jgi:putative SOS response-associated peptidase YedK
MMCGRFVGFRSLEELKDLFPIDRAACEVVANFNVAPTQEVLVLQNWKASSKMTFIGNS